jgi:hypothetical protein
VRFCITLYSDTFHPTTTSTSESKNAVNVLGPHFPSELRNSQHSLSNQVRRKIPVLYIPFRHPNSHNLRPPIYQIQIFDVEILSSNLTQHFPKIAHTSRIDRRDASPVSVPGTSLFIPATTTTIISRCSPHGFLDINVPRFRHITLDRLDTLASPSSMRI